MKKDFKITDGTNTATINMAGLLGLGAAIVALNFMKYTSASGINNPLFKYNITGTDAYWRIKPKNKWVKLRGPHFLSIYNQTYYHRWEIGPMFYYGTVQAPIL